RHFFEWVREASSSRAPEAEAEIFSEEEDAIRLLTIHASKGLDFPIVFIPGVGRAPQGAERRPFLLEMGTANKPPMLSARVYDEHGILHEPPSYRRAYQVSSNRKRAEAFRLAYVATTRASEGMFLVGDRTPPKSAKSKTHESTIASVLSSLVEDE